MLATTFSGGAIWWTLTRYRQAWCSLKAVWSMPERFRVVCTIKALYKCSDLPLPYTGFLNACWTPSYKGFTLWHCGRPRSTRWRPNILRPAVKTRVITQTESSVIEADEWLNQERRVLIFLVGLQLRLRVKVEHRLLNLCDCDSVLSERCRQILEIFNSPILLQCYLNLISVTACYKVVWSITHYPLFHYIL